MQASPVLNRLSRSMAVRDWAWWRLPLVLRSYVAAVPVAALAVIVFSALQTDWRVSDIEKFLILLLCGTISVASTPRVMYEFPGVTQDFTTVWVLPTAILLPPIYAALVPIPFLGILHYWVYRGVPHRMVFTAASISLSYAAASLAFHSSVPYFSGQTVGSGTHAFIWTVVVAACYIAGGRIQRFLVVAAVKLSNPSMRIWKLEWNREAFQELFVEIDLGVLITLAVALTPLLVVIAVPTVLMVRRFLVYPLLVAQSRIDSKTGLLNVSTWETEAENEISRSIRTHNPVALALVDIDHFKTVNDTYGHLIGDKVLKAVAVALSSDLRTYDRAGRFGGEEFVVLLAQTSQGDACKIADRLRAKVADLAVPVSDRPGAAVVTLTISIGVTAMDRGETRELNDLLAAADTALYHAKKSGRNRVASCTAERDMLEAELNGHHAVVFQVDQTGASLGPGRIPAGGPGAGGRGCVAPADGGDVIGGVDLGGARS